MNCCHDIIKRLVRTYVGWPGPKGPGQVPEPFLGTCEPGRVHTLFLGINPGGQPVPDPPQTADEHIAHAVEYFRQGKGRQSWGVPGGEATIWTKYGYFFPDATAVSTRRLASAALYRALATQSLITNLVHWPSQDTKALLREPWVDEWINTSTPFVQELIACARPALIVVQHRRAWEWLWRNCDQRPFAEGNAPDVYGLYQVGAPVGFQSPLAFVCDTGYRPFILPVMHLSRFWAKKELLERYADEVARVPWGG